MKPYVGISGIGTREQAGLVARHFLDNGFSRQSPHMGMIGYCVSADMLNGRPAPSPRYVSPREFSQVLEPDQSFGINALHFVPLLDAGAASDEACVAQIVQLLMGSGAYDGGLCRVVQINHATEAVGPAALRRLKEEMPDLGIILQVGRRALTERSPAELSAHLRPYSPFADLFLIDPSQGQGKAIVRDAVQQSVVAILGEHSNVPLGFAGGLDPENLRTRMTEFSSLTRRPFSIDVESGVRGADDRLSVEKTGAFIIAASRWLAGWRKRSSEGVDAP